MTLLPPQANFLAVREENPEILAELERRFTAHGFAKIWRPARGWLVGIAPLPHSEPDGETTFAAGLVFAEGRDEITGTLGTPDTEILQRAAHLMDERPAALAELPGNFGCLRFRADGGVTAVRSCSGRAPIYWWAKGTRLALATRLTYFPQLLPDRFALDPFVNAVWTAGHCLFPDGRTFLADVRCVERGGYASFAPHASTPVSGTYWPPVPADPLPAPSPEKPARLRELLIRAVRRDLHPDGGNLLTLSGGLDSCCLAVIATRLAGRKIATWSKLPTDDHHYGVEKSFITPLAELCGFERSWELRLRLEERADLFAKFPPIVFQVMHPALTALPDIHAEWPVRVLLGGEFADEVCGSFYTVPDWVGETSPGELLASIQRGDSEWRDAARWLKHRSLDLLKLPMLPLPKALPTLIHPQIHAEYAEWRDREQRRASGDSGAWRYFRLRLRHEEFPVMNWEACSTFGIRRSIPFMDREVLDLTLSCHPSELIRPAHKKLLKAAMGDDVPRHVLHQPHKRNWGLRPQADAMRFPWTGALPDGLQTMVRHDWPDRARPAVTYEERSALTQLMKVTQSARAFGCTGAAQGEL